jgi:hypothetical protein
MDARQKDKDGLTICPQCLRHYKPTLGERDGRLIQVQFPNATPEEREQLLTGLCSTACWNKFLGMR